MRWLYLMVLFPLLASTQEVDPFDPSSDLELDAEAVGLHVARLEGPWQEYIDKKSAIQVAYRASLAAAFKQADGAEIFLLSFTPVMEFPEFPEEEENYFPISPYGSYSKILSRKVLKDGELEECRSAVAELLKEEDDLGGGAFCHFPIHGVRLFAGEDLIFETSLCWKCSNYYLAYPDDYRGPGWVGFRGEPIMEFLMKAMPIPQSELDRFEAKYGDKREGEAGEESEPEE